MDKNVQALARFFEESWQPMLSLMARARAIEFRVRLASEVHAQATFSNSRTWDEFQRGSKRVVRQKLERHIKTLCPSFADQMIIIRQCADGLAHADYRAARVRIDQYQKQFPLSSRVSNVDVGMMLYKNISHPDGTTSDVGYLLNTSDDNLILEEYEVFVKQGYAAAAGEMLTLAEQALQDVVPKLNLKYAALVMSRGLKYGKRV